MLGQFHSVAPAPTITIFMSSSCSSKLAVRYVSKIKQNPVPDFNGFLHGFHGSEFYGSLRCRKKLVVQPGSLLNDHNAQCRCWSSTGYFYIGTFDFCHPKFKIPVILKYFFGKEMKCLPVRVGRWLPDKIVAETSDSFVYQSG